MTEISVSVTQRRRSTTIRLETAAGCVESTELRVRGLAPPAERAIKRVIADAERMNLIRAVPVAEEESD